LAVSVLGGGSNVVELDSATPRGDPRGDDVNLRSAPQVLEHVQDPDASLDELRRVLRQRGTLYVYKLPNRFSYLERIGRAAGLYYHGRSPLDRLYTRASAHRLLARHGYEVVELRNANMLPLTLTGRVATAMAPAIWAANRELARVPLLNRFATNIELVAVAPSAESSLPATV
jgi:hypothetical protein